MPDNTAVVAGLKTSLRCVSTTSQSLNWLFTQTNGPPYTTIVSGCQVNPSYIHRYGIENSGPGRCDLVVLNATIEDVGMYGCLGFDPSASALLAILCE